MFGTRVDQKWFQESARERLLLNHMGTLGPEPDLGDVQEFRVLNRILRYVQLAYKPDECAYVEWEPDPHHVEILLANAGLGSGAKSLSTPDIKMPAGTDCSPLSPEERHKCRSMTMRMAYLAQDRIDLPICTSELARQMQAPTLWDQQQLKRAYRYLLDCHRIVQRFRWQEMPTEIVVFSDSDHDGCLRARKSTSCATAFFDNHVARNTSTTQGVISLSSGASEFYSAVKAASIGLFLVAILRDKGVELKQPVSLKMDAAAGIGVASRREAGRIRHISTPTLCLQDAVPVGRVCLSNWNTEENPAYLGTMFLDRSRLIAY